MNIVRSIILIELKRIYKSKLLYLSSLMIIIISLIENPLLTKKLWIDETAAHFFNSNVIMAGILTIPLLTLYLFKHDKNEGVQDILNSQPINIINYAIGKYFVMLVVFFSAVLISLAIFLLMPLFFNNAPYSLITFLRILSIKVIPTILFYGALTFFVEVLLNSSLCTLIFPIAYTMINSDLPVMLDFRVDNKIFYPLVLGNELEDRVYHLYIANRWITLLLGIVLFIIYLIIYSRGSNNRYKTIVNKIFVRVKNKMYIKRINPSIKIASSLALNGCIVMLILSLFTFITKSINTWYTVKYILMLIPTFFITPIVTEVVTNKREAIIFLTNTPKYKQMIRRLRNSFLLSQGFIFILFILAILSGVESGINKYLTILVDSTFLAIWGLTVANIFKKAYMGYVAAVTYWAVNIGMGSALGEKIWYISIFFNVEIQYMMIWESLVVMSVMSIFLLLFNIWYIGKDDQVNRYLSKGFLVGLTASCIILSAYHFSDSNNSWSVFTEVNSKEVYEISKDEYTFSYPVEIPKDVAKDIMEIWIVTQSELNKFLPQNMQYKRARLSREFNRDYDELLLTYDFLKEFNPPKYGITNWIRSCVKSIIAQSGLGSIDDEILLNGLTDYIMYTKVLPQLESRYNEAYWSKTYKSYQRPSYIPQYIDEIASLEEREIKNITALEGHYVVGYLLLYVETHYETHFNNMLSKLFSEEIESMRDIQNIYQSFISEDEVMKLFEKYDVVKEKYNRFYSNGTMIPIKGGDK